MNGSISNKVVASTTGTGIAGAITMILTYLVQIIWKVEVPPEVALATSTVISTLAAGFAGYLTPHGPPANG
jgi:uncharacterized membrane protein YfcA